MKNILALLIVSILVSSCDKDEFTTAPQIKFISINPNFAQREGLTNLSPNVPKLTIEVTDAEGDIGGLDFTDSSLIVVRNLKSNNVDEFRFPDLTRAQKPNFKAEITINLFSALDCVFSPVPGVRTDTIFYEIYVQDAKKNKSNVIISTDPLFYRCP